MLTSTWTKAPLGSLVGTFLQCRLAFYKVGGHTASRINYGKVLTSGIASGRSWQQWWPSGGWLGRLRSTCTVCGISGIRRGHRTRNLLHQEALDERSERSRVQCPSELVRLGFVPCQLGRPLRVYAPPAQVDGTGQVEALAMLAGVTASWGRLAPGE